MRCRGCGRDIESNSIFCNWCGAQQIRERKRAVTVPAPRLLPSGNWTIQLRREGMRITCRTAEECRTEAISARKQWLADEASGLHREQQKNILLSDAITRYIESKRSRLRNKSIEQYEYIRDKRFESLMSMHINDITSDDVDAAIEQELRKKSRKGGTVSAKTVIDAYGLVASVLRKYAKNSEIDVSLPEMQRRFPVILAPEEIYPAVKGTDIELDCLLAMWLSLTISEIRGLTKSKSVRGSKLYIVETVVDVHGKAERRDGGKEETRPRVYDIPPYIGKLIDKVEGDVIEPRSSHAVYMRFQRLLVDAGLPKMRFHALRHVNASVMAEEDIPTVIAQERGGWKTDSTMKRVYTHTFTASRLEADKKINARFEKLVENTDFTHEITHEK